jgi:hypothetical protein
MVERRSPRRRIFHNLLRPGLGREEIGRLCNPPSDQRGGWGWGTDSTSCSGREREDAGMCKWERERMRYDLGTEGSREPQGGE